jgi:hypothetical protein
MNKKKLRKFVGCVVVNTASNYENINTGCPLTRTKDGWLIEKPYNKYFCRSEKELVK